MKNLYDLTAELLELEQWLEDQDGDVTGEEDKLEQYFESQDNLEEKVDNYCALIAELEARARARSEEASRLSSLASADSSKASRLKDRLFQALQVMNVDRIDAPRFRVTVCNNGGRLPLILDDVDLDDLPADFVKVSVNIDRSAIYKKLDEGEELEFARYGERGQHLRIK